MYKQASQNNIAALEKTVAAILDEQNESHKLLIFPCDNVLASFQVTELPLESGLPSLLRPRNSLLSPLCDLPYLLHVLNRPKEQRSFHSPSLSHKLTRLLGQNSSFAVRNISRTMATQASHSLYRSDLVLRFTDNAVRLLA